jgi:exopolysaccharide production protein ExoY
MAIVNQASVLDTDPGQLALQGATHQDALRKPRLGDAAQSASALPATARPLGGLTKRAFDVLLACIVLLVAGPLLLLLAAIIKLTTGGPAIFAHPRVGYGGRSFPCFKLCTMVPNGNEVLQAHFAQHPEALREWSATQKLRQDPRVTRLGQILRRSSLDELPQLINVLRGEMSCVGPRPIVTAELERYGPEIDVYLSARPGMTGAWQVGGRSRVDYSQRVAMDTLYVRKWTFTGDLVILLKTIPVTASFDGSC